jgi:hypothetical protein
MQDQHETISGGGDPRSADIITRISAYDRLALVDEWQKAFGSKPAKNISSSILIRIITHEHQCRTYGGLNAASKRTLRTTLGSSDNARSSDAVSNLANADSELDRLIIPPTSQGSQSSIRTGTPTHNLTPVQSPLLSTGTQLVREWNGRPYRVEVTEAGFVLDGKCYSSLSAIAKKITGAHWSGPRFFGLNKAARPTRQQVGK